MAEWQEVTACRLVPAAPPLQQRSCHTEHTEARAQNGCSCFFVFHAAKPLRTVSLHDNTPCIEAGLCHEYLQRSTRQRESPAGGNDAHIYTEIVIKNEEEGEDLCTAGRRTSETKKMMKCTIEARCRQKKGSRRGVVCASCARASKESREEMATSVEV
jgi:hypothetical protein